MEKNNIVVAVAARFFSSSHLCNNLYETYFSGQQLTAEGICL